MTAIADILGGHWDRSEFLRPEQLWREYGELMTRLKPGATFRSTVCVPSDPALLFDDTTFGGYVLAIYYASRSQGVKVKRLLVLNCEEWPPDQDALDHKVLDHLRELRKIEESTPTLEARVTIDRFARDAFHEHPDFMVWGDGLLIQSDLNGADGLVTQAEFYFASNSYTEEIDRRQKQFDKLFEDADHAIPLTAIV